MAVKHDQRIMPILEALLEAVAEEVAACGRGDIGFSSIQSGDLGIVEHVGEDVGCSELIVNLTSVFSYQDFPAPAEVAQCNDPTAYVITVAMFRCAPQPKGRDVRINDPALHHASALEVIDDMHAMRRAISSVIKDQDRVHALGTFEPYGPEGGIIGGSWTITIGD